MIFFQKQNIHQVLKGACRMLLCQGIIPQLLLPLPDDHGKTRFRGLPGDRG